MISISHEKTGKVLGKNIKIATTTFDRMRGLMFMDNMVGFDGLCLNPCRSIHNFFVRFPIDVIFVDKHNKVVKVIKGFKPWAMTRVYFTAQKTIELPSGTIDFEINRGDQLEVKNV